MTLLITRIRGQHAPAPSLTHEAVGSNTKLNWDRSLGTTLRALTRINKVKEVDGVMEVKPRELRRIKR